MQETYNLKNYLIVYLDLLNTSELLQKIENIDISIHNSHELHAIAMRETFGVVKDFFNTFYYSMDIFFEKIGFRSERDRYIKRYSDSVILYLPIEMINQASIHLLLDTLCDFMFCILSSGIPCRGSISNGKGAEIEVNRNEIQIFGPVLANAVELEKKAGYPSIILSSEFVSNFIPSVFIDKYLYFDDSYFRINILADSVKANLYHEEYFEKLKIFISDSLEKYQKDKKIFSRYKKLEQIIFA